MTKPIQLAGGLWTFPIVLPDNPLKWLNCYVIKGEGGGRSLLVDTGFDLEACRAELFAGMEALGLRPGDTDVFLTHLHSDHSGNAAVLQRLGCRILMGEREYALFAQGEDARWAAGKRRALAEGMSEVELERIDSEGRAVIYTSGAIDAVTVNDGDRLSYGGYELECVETPGHSPGHMCLWNREHGVLFLGDHVLFDITPNICAWSCMADSLGDYLESLKRIRGYDVRLPLPGHRYNGRGKSLAGRVDALLGHHRRRLAEAESIVAGGSGMDAYSVAARMSWHIKACDWEHFPVTQKYFALSETLSHLDHLVIEGRIRRAAGADGRPVYF